MNLKFLSRQICIGCCLLTICAADSVVADEFPTSVRKQTAKQLLELMKRAPDADMIVTEIRTSASGSRLLFNATFAKNSDEVAWLLLVNIDRKRLTEAKKEYASKGYTNTILRSASAGGKRLYTAVWTKPKDKPRALKLPSVAIPMTGPADPRCKPLDDMIVAFLKEHNAAGATVAVARDGRMLYARGFGYANVATKETMRPNHAMRIASISKPITGVAIMMLVEQGKLKLDDPVVPLLNTAGYPLPTGDDRWSEITVRHLLNHSAGWDRDVSRDPMFQVIEATHALKLKQPARQKDLLTWKMSQSLDFDPGEKYAYSNFGYCILGRLIEAVANQPYDQFVASSILTPQKMRSARLGKTRLEDTGINEVHYHMQNTSTHLPFWASLTESSRDGVLKVVSNVEEPYGRWDLEVMDAHGGWVMSAPDLLRFVAGINAEQQPLLNEESRAVMLSRPVLGGKEKLKSHWYGCGWSVRSAGRGGKVLDHHNIWHNGALAGTSTLLVRRWDGFSWAVLFNTDQSSNGERLSGLIDSNMHTAVDRVTQWPTEDLFPLE